MSFEIKVIATKYKGILFRSRLEARWAVFMDNLGIEWCYEFEGYDMNGIYYLPDFWLPTFDGGSFLEVKPKKVTDIEKQKCYMLCLGSGNNVILAEGLPDFKCQRYFYKETHEDKEDCVLAYGLMNADQAFDEDRMFSYPGYENEDLTISKEYYDCLGELYYEAVNAAQTERSNK